MEDRVTSFFLNLFIFNNMKSKYLIWGLLAVMFGASLSYAFKGDETPRMAEFVGNEGGEFYAIGGLSAYSFTRDSISNTANDTTVIPGRFASDFTYRIAIQLANGTGTRALKIYLDDYNGGQSNNAGIYATGWTVRDSIASAVLNNEYAFIGQHVYGLKHRIRVDGNTGATQKTYFRINAQYKAL